MFALFRQLALHLIAHSASQLRHVPCLKFADMSSIYCVLEKNACGITHVSHL